MKQKKPGIAVATQVKLAEKQVDLKMDHLPTTNIFELLSTKKTKLLKPSALGPQGAPPSCQLHPSKPCVTTKTASDSSHPSCYATQQAMNLPTATLQTSQLPTAQLTPIQSQASTPTLNSIGATTTPAAVATHTNEHLSPPNNDTENMDTAESEVNEPITDAQTPHLIQLGAPSQDIQLNALTPNGNPFVASADSFEKFSAATLQAQAEANSNVQTPILFQIQPPQFKWQPLDQFIPGKRMNSSGEKDGIITSPTFSAAKRRNISQHAVSAGIVDILKESQIRAENERKAKAAYMAEKAEKQKKKRESYTNKYDEKQNKSDPTASKVGEKNQNKKQPLPSAKPNKHGSNPKEISMAYNEQKRKNNPNGQRECIGA